MEVWRVLKIRYQVQIINIEGKNGLFISKEFWGCSTMMEIHWNKKDPQLFWFRNEILMISIKINQNLMKISWSSMGSRIQLTVGVRTLEEADLLKKAFLELNPGPGIYQILHLWIVNSFINNKIIFENERRKYN